MQAGFIRQLAKGRLQWLLRREEQLVNDAHECGRANEDGLCRGRQADGGTSQSQPSSPPPPPARPPHHRRSQLRTCGAAATWQRRIHEEEGTSRAWGGERKGRDPRHVQEVRKASAPRLRLVTGPTTTEAARAPAPCCRVRVHGRGETQWYSSITCARG